MRLTFSTSHYRNADLCDEQGRRVYTIHTPSLFSGKTTITKHSGGFFGRAGSSEVIAVIEWHRLRGTKIHFRGQVNKANDILTRGRWSTSDRHFIGPDGRPYKWKLRSNTLNCVNSRTELAKFHKRNFGLMSRSHAPYLDISPSVTHMLDYIVTTFVYVEKLSQDKRNEAAASAAGA
ncbi:hypothetical protein HYDPIDRAFT_92440 [Hydnomerulius pinastri MD-312]|uniref:Unplaced genomic scaffold scaffold_17, whole genome shotgun sequence n=1 Tax=Hydnomerulius pinastri MD-312 TaxID=994086 RepID=A0A0C9WDW5_9AGAM|nr:hypothetical protein HYDPIDRAFT_92440 [Hydnomerulius pinastri MD-312]